MTNYMIKKSLRVLDRAIEHLGPTKPCSLLIDEGRIVGMLPHSLKDEARAILAGAMCDVVRETSRR